MWYLLFFLLELILNFSLQSGLCGCGCGFKFINVTTLMNPDQSSFLSIFWFHVLSKNKKELPTHIFFEKDELVVQGKELDF